MVTDMKKRYVIAGIAAILLWNGFLIHRDAQLFQSMPVHHE
jgi:hypothetical protein